MGGDQMIVETLAVGPLQCNCTIGVSVEPHFFGTQIIKRQCNYTAGSKLMHPVRKYPQLELRT